MHSAVHGEAPGSRYLFPTLMLALVVFFNFLARMVFSPLLVILLSGWLRDRLGERILIGAGIGPPETLNVVVSLMMPACYIFGGGIFPAIMGILGDHGLFFAGFVVVGLATLASLLFLRFLSGMPRRTIPAPATPG